VFIDLKIVENWQANFVEINDNKISYSRQWSDDNKHHVASPKMNSLAKYLANDINIKLQTKISKIIKKPNYHQRKLNQMFLHQGFLNFIQFYPYQV
jgi:predicted NAD/FAD-dependent oxidoreductase